MNTYNDNQLIAVKSILSNIDNESIKKNSAKTVAQYNLYFSVGSQLLAQDKFDQVNAEFKETLNINDQGVACSNRANNLLNSVQLADQNVATVVTNTATVAQNVQVAVNAVLKLSSNIGSAMNIVSASEYETDIQRMTNDVNEVIKETAYHAELASQYAMESSTQASQIISKEVLQETNITKNDFDNMLQCTQANLDKLAAVRIADTNKLTVANSTQRTNAGIFHTIQEEYNALNNAYIVSNHDLNLALTVEVKSKEEINVSFNEFKPPFGQAAVPSGQDCRFPPPKYFITIIKADAKDMFNYDVAETAFNTNKDSFFSVEPNKHNSINLSKSKDAFGKEITFGTSYAVVLYLELDNIYKKSLNDYNDKISAASNTFVLATKLDKFSSTDASSNVIKFTGSKEEPSNAEHRCILLPTQSLFTKDSTDNPAQDSTDTWFDLNIAIQVSADNYTLAKTQDKNSYEVTLDEEATDCFGALLIANKTYTPAILAIVPNTESNANEYAPTLSKLMSITWQNSKTDETNTNA